MLIFSDFSSFVFTSLLLFLLLQQPGAALARHVLAEVPQQLCAYCKTMGIVPGGVRG